MTTETDTAFRDPNPSIVATLRDEIDLLRRENDRLTAELAKRDSVRPRLTISAAGRSDGAIFLGIVAGASAAFNAGNFVPYGPAPFVLRWAAVNVVAVALWCLAFVRREAKP